ncbi:hypothetical protein COU57_06405 [Candidatus Pacearchaeota archaeon CG10_big_fil_rev_8_21_14_0_10_32_14]|nr:MAG: hypothetical protein COU57_06405 [Candidatus Pacearchaeota archaeon CG10_big_fil_rev_8_21_14_0_10_32_14]
MSDISIIIISTLFGALISYLSISLAFYLLFHPKNPKIYGLIHGALPKRKDFLAENIASHIDLILPLAYKKITKIPLIGGGVETIVHKVIERTIKETSNEDIEILIKKVINKELRMIKLLGIIIGGLIGLIQGIIIILLI